jgi:hypothetical protein
VAADVYPGTGHASDALPTQSEYTGNHRAVTSATSRRDFRLALVGLAALTVGLRFPNIFHGLPEVLTADDAMFATHARNLLDGPFEPTTDGAQPLVINILAATAGLARLLGLNVSSLADIVSAGRVVFAAIGVLTVGVGTWLAFTLTSSSRSYVPTLGTGFALAVNYQMVRLGRGIAPDPLQLTMVAASFLCVVRFDRSRSWRWLAAASLFAGLAGASKYIGVFVILSVAGSIMFWGSPVAHKIKQVAFAAFFTILGFLSGAPATVADPAAFFSGIITQFTRQTTGHLGYEPEGNGWAFHLGETLPGSWGHLLTAMGVLGVVYVSFAGTRIQRLSLATSVPLFVTIGAFQARLPYYPLILTPFLATYAFLIAERLGDMMSRRWSWVIPAILIVSLSPTLLHDVRLIRAAGAPDTQLLANSRLAALPGDACLEAYTASQPRDTDTRIGQLDDRDVTGCSCFLVISSYLEERYRRRPDLYADRIEAYDRARAVGVVYDVVAPTTHLTYRWDLLPGWGIESLPLVGDIGPVGPTITILDMRTGSRSGTEPSSSVCVAG